jgi:signal transduction histidine kinase/ActR/RegA family two-component response regulator
LLQVLYHSLCCFAKRLDELLYKLNPLHSKLSRRFFAVVSGLLIAAFTLVYWYSVPLIKQKVFEIERSSSRLILNNVFELANRMYANMEDYRAQALQVHQQQLMTSVAITASYLRSSLKQGYSREQAFNTIRDFSFGQRDYIWVADYQGTILSHPDPRFHGKTASSIPDKQGSQILMPIIQLAVKQGAGFYPYQWQKLDGTQALAKISYVKSYPEWGLVIGAGVYLDDIEQEVAQRKARALHELRAALATIQVAKTGYLFVFDSKAHMLIHPNANIDQTEFKTLQNPLTQHAIANDLMTIADTGKELTYLWDKPSDPGHYVYEKLSLVRYLKGFDWYICSSVYTDELQSSALLLSNRILTIAFITLVLSLGLAFYFIRRITQPLNQLAATAWQVSQGDLNARSSIQQNDEIGLLAHSFDGMVQRLKTTIDSLDSEVKQRTNALLETNAKAQRMQAVAQLAGGLAHDFNNLLAIILGNLRLITESTPHQVNLTEYTEPALRAATRGTELTQRLLAFARRQPLQTQVIELQHLLDEVLLLLKNTLGQHIHLSYSHNNPQTIWLKVDANQLENALINLALNAKEAMPKGGRIHMSVSLADYQQTLAPNDFDEPIQPALYALLQIEDTGLGFSEAAQVAAFEPFYSTKQGKNSGLGLSMVYGFVKQSQGYIQIANRKPHGACISLLLPLVPTPSSTNAQASLTHEPTLQGKLWLLVEDDADVRQLIRHYLVDFGLQVIEAEDAQEASELIKQLPELVGMVSDMLLNGSVQGLNLAQQLQQQQPHSVIVLMSAYTPLDFVPTAGQGWVFLSKPFTAEALQQALHQALSRQGVSPCSNAN